MNNSRVRPAQSDSEIDAWSPWPDHQPSLRDRAVKGIVRTIWLVLPLLLICCAPTDHEAPPVDPAKLESELLQADRAFAQATAERGLDGWLSFFAEDAARVEMHGRIIRGLPGIREYDGELLDDPSLELRWDPTDAGVFGDGELGFTRGRYELLKTTPDQAVEQLSTGSYLTIWQHRKVGWRVVLDTGAPDEKAD